jgi:hypothetical protein
MEQFIRLANIERFTKRIVNCPAGSERETLLKLLAEEIARKPKPTK